MAVPTRRRRLLLLLAMVSAGLHFYRLSEPRSVVFDEVWFGDFVNAYTGSHAYFFDVHPPHAKLLVAGVAALGGYRGGQGFASIHTPIDQVSPALLRFVPALAGSLIPLIVFALLIQLGASEWGALVGALAIALDNALLIQTRILALDGVLLAATLGALSAYLAALRARSHFRRRAWTLICGSLVGLAIGTKFTGLGALAIVGVCGIGEWLRDRRASQLPVLAGDAAVVTLVALAVYAAGWWVHFGLLSEPGPGDRWGAPTGAWLADTWAVHARMWSANVGLSAGHPYASAWWSWPLMLRAVSYWSENGRELFFLGNPVVWWGSAVGMVVVLAALPLRALTAHQPGEPVRAWPPMLWIPLSGWAISYAPLVGVSRVLFLYHYLTPLVFSVIAVALWLDHSGGWTRPGSWRAQRPSVWVTLAALVVGFALISPFTFSYVNAPDYQRAIYTAIPGWR
jgi:dolichyl-phosphate-mannose-protein mannosyltransferase